MKDKKKYLACSLRNEQFKYVSLKERKNIIILFL